MGDQEGFQGQNPAAFVEHSVEAEVLNSMILVVHALPQYRVKRLGLGFFRGFSPGQKKGPKSARSPSAELLGEGQLMDAGGL